MELSPLLLVSSFFIGFFVVLKIIPKCKDAFLKSQLFGKDMNKESGVIPEAAGVLSGSVFLVLTFSAIPLVFSNYLFSTKSDDFGQTSNFPHEEFVHLLAALLSISSMLLLGFVDDVLDLKWRHKLFLPTIASLPLLFVYYVTVNRTLVVIPTFVSSFLSPFFEIGETLDLGLFYYVYMGSLSVFCTNAINIFAGINGLEVGQSIVIAVSVLFFNLFEILGSSAEALSHIFSLYFLFPFLGTSAGLLFHNWCPASVFVGDTFCYFAGMTLAVVSILGHFSKTLLLFFIPQILNFLYSAPQLFSLLPCPRHRLPSYDPKKQLLRPSTVSFTLSSLGPLGKLIYSLLSAGHCIQVSEKLTTTTNSRNEKVITMNNLTLINYAIILTGPIHEKHLTPLLLTFQILCSILAFLIRYPIANFIYG